MAQEQGHHEAGAIEQRADEEGAAQAHLEGSGKGPAGNRDGHLAGRQALLDPVGCAWAGIQEIAWSAECGVGEAGGDEAGSLEGWESTGHRTMRNRIRVSPQEQKRSADYNDADR